MHEPELGVDQIEVHVQTPPRCRHRVHLALGVAAQLERGARLHGTQHTHQTFGDPITLGDPTGRVILRQSRTGARTEHVDVRPAGISSHSLSVGDHLLGRLLHVGAEPGDRHTLRPQPRPQRTRPEQPTQITLEDQPVEHRQRTDEPFPMQFLERRNHDPPPTPTRDSKSLPRRCKGTGPGSAGPAQLHPPPRRHLVAAERSEAALRASFCVRRIRVAGVVRCCCSGAFGVTRCPGLGVRVDVDGDFGRPGVAGVGLEAQRAVLRPRLSVDHVPAVRRIRSRRCRDRRRRR